MNDTSSQRISAVTNVLQLAVLVVGAGGVFFALGGRDEVIKDAVHEISELKSISSDLVKAQVLSQAKNGEQDRMLADILRRLERIEER
tara:strand:- start:815 stop:1078 length:264 start_codon:yes stop_codon:yes gene_type:complete